MEKTKNTSEKDIEILKSLYFGNYLNEIEQERALKLLFLLDRSLKDRIN